MLYKCFLFAGKSPGQGSQISRHRTDSRSRSLSDEWIIYCWRGGGGCLLHDRKKIFLLVILIVNENLKTQGVTYLHVIQKALVEFFGLRADQ